MQRDLIRPLFNAVLPRSGVTVDWLKEKVIPAASIFETNFWVEAGNELTKGKAGLFVDGQNGALLIGFYEHTSRAVEQPVSEVTVRGPADAFNEDLRTNLALLRKRLRTTRLAVEKMEIGVVTKTAVCLVYLKGYLPGGLLEEVKSRLETIKVDSVISSGQLEEYIQDNPYSIVGAIGVTERPDVLAAELLEGKVGIVVDNTPFALIAPTTIIFHMHSPEDYYNRYWFASMIRIIRWVALHMALLLPSLYIAVTSYHQEMVPTDLLLAIMTAREGVPYPAIIEALLMEITFEILREAGVRLPRPFGQTISIVGAIVIGQAAVGASLVSPVMVIVVALTAVASYTIPTVPFTNAVRVLRFPFMIAAAAFGLFGVMAAMLILTFHLCSLRSFGVPYLSPIAPLSLGDLKDSFVRVPAWMMRKRPRLTGTAAPERQPAGNKPHPPPNRGDRGAREGGGS